MLNPDRQVTRAIGEADNKGCLPLKTVDTLDEAVSVLDVWSYDRVRILMELLEIERELAGEGKEAAMERYDRVLIARKLLRLQVRDGK